MERIYTDKAPEAVGPYSQAMEAGGFVFVSGQLPIDRATGKMPQAIEDQAAQSIENLKSILEAAGASLSTVVKTTVYLTDMGDFAKVNEVYGRYFSEPYPARVAIEISKLPLGAHVEIDAIASK